MCFTNTLNNIFKSNERKQYFKIICKNCIIYRNISLVAFIEISRIFNSRFQSDASENKQATFFPQPSSWTSSILSRVPE